MRYTTQIGEIGISNGVIAVIAANAASSCFGVRGMAGKSALDGLDRLLRGESRSQGVTVTTTEDNQITLELHIAIDRQVNITAICHSIVSRVRYDVERLTGIKVADIIVCIDDIKA